MPDLDYQPPDPAEQARRADARGCLVETIALAIVAAIILAGIVYAATHTTARPAVFGE